MPRANCCFWSKAALRALWCWVEGLDEDGGDALEPIDYDRCGPGPDVALLYPEPGPACETSGLCPVEIDETGGTGFSALYADVLVMRCSGGACHDQTPAGGVVRDHAARPRAAAARRARPGPHVDRARRAALNLQAASDHRPPVWADPRGRAPRRGRCSPAQVGDSTRAAGGARLAL